jgi:CBS domain containing-hemolysin-like protein
MYNSGSHTGLLQASQSRGTGGRVARAAEGDSATAPAQRKSRHLATRPHLVPSICAAILLVAALWEWPYGYYGILRWVTCAVAIFVAYKAYTWRANWGAWLFGLMAAIFNPLFPIHFSRPVWAVIDLAAAALLVAAIVFLRNPSVDPKQNHDQ